MKIHYLLLSTILFTLSTINVFGQTNKPCNNFDCAYKKAETFLKKAAYQKALDNLDSAEGYLTDTNTKEKEQIKQLRRRLFVAIEKEKEDAKKARDEAKRQTEIAKNALAQVEIEKQMAIAAEKKAKAVLDKIYFYDDKFGLAYDRGYYGFIDKDLKTKIDFKYEQALPFDNMGLAKVKKKYGYYYLIDTTGNEYKLATDINQLDSSITALDLRDKNLKDIPFSVFENTQLKILLLGSNQLNNLPIEIGKLINLIKLDLFMNQLSSLPKEFFKLTNLTNLYLGTTNLNNLPKEIGMLTNLTTLDLHSNQLYSLPSEIETLTNLTILSLGGNQLNNIPTEMFRLTNLKTLDLAGNRLNILPTEIFRLTNLTGLYLERNELINLPTEIEKLTNLIDLNLSNTKLKNIPTEIGKLTNLTNLNLSYNKLENLPSEICKLTNLTNLDLSYNKLKKLPVNIEELINLNKINLRYNELKNLPPEMGKLINLMTLDLSENKIIKEDKRKIKMLLPNCLISDEQLEVKKLGLYIAYESDTIKIINLCKAIIDILEEAYKEDNSRNEIKTDLVFNYNFLAWYQLLKGQFKEAELNIRHGLELEPNKLFLFRRLAPALLLEGKYEDAKIIYLEQKDKSFGNPNKGLCKDAFLDDLNTFEKIGIIPKERKEDVEKIRQLLTEN